MSVEVVNEAIGYKIDCPFCKSVLKFSREDIEDDFPYSGGSVECPVCKKKINVAGCDDELITMVEPIMESPKGYFDEDVYAINKRDAYRNIMLCGDKEE